MSHNGFTNLVVFEIANNHQGDAAHGLSLLDSLGAVVDKAYSAGFWPVVKFQLRDLDTFINPKYSNKHTKRFLETRLEQGQFHRLVAHAKYSTGCPVMVTPFDEVSVAALDDMEVDYCKVASCSATDWPLLSAIGNQYRPIIASTGGCSTEDMDNLVSFFTHRGKEYALNHCMARYPHTPSCAGLGMIRAMIKRYACTIGWSGHEKPDDCRTAQLAYAIGARMFETHVCLPTKKYPANAYSRDPKQLMAWLDALVEARDACLLPKNRVEERAQLRELQRGAWVAGSGIRYQMPAQPGQAVAGEVAKGSVLTTEKRDGEPLGITDFLHVDAVSPLKRAIHRIKALLNEAGVVLPPAFETEYSHHFGPGDFESVGTTMITIVNRDYAKKILVMLPNQCHPNHYHRRKEETFHVLHGDLTVWLDGREFYFTAGQTVLVQPGVWHWFKSDNGCVFEEVSTTAYADDSVYSDGRITGNAQRKTKASNWGRWEIE